jgi:NADH dehydrogenase (ubiquinone) 1 beta subcomplex subunit 7
MIATREEMKAAKLDIGYRDFCAHLLIPLNACRRKSFYLPWKCEHERHVYEKCQYKEYVMYRLRRVRGRWRASARVGARGLR